MKKILLILTTILLLASCSSSNNSNTNNDSAYQVGILQFVEHPSLDDASQGFKDAIKDSGLEVDYQEQNAQGDMSNSETIATTFVNDGLDLIFANATPAAQAAKSKTDTIPIVITSVTDPAASGLVESNETGNTNVTGTSDMTPIVEQLDLLYQIVPDAKKIAIMYTSSEENSIIQKDIAIEYLASISKDYVEASVADSTSIQAVTENLIGKVDAIYIPTDNLLAENTALVASIANENNLPTVVGATGMVTDGGLASYGIDYYQLGYQAGEMAVEILKGADPKDMPIQYQDAARANLIINESSLESLQLTLSDSIINDAELVK